jgi:hypothetical protein
MDVPGGFWAFAVTFVPGVLTIIAGNVVLLRSKAQADKQRGVRITIIGFSLLTLVPGVVLAVLVLLGEARPVALIGAALMIGWAALRFWAIRAF